jgi:hypothetical protein
VIGKGMLWNREMTKQGTTAEYKTYLNRLLTRDTETNRIKCLRKIKGKQRGTELETQFREVGILFT